MKQIQSMISLTSKVRNKAPSMPEYTPVPQPVAVPETPTVDNSAEVARAKALEQQRALSMKGLQDTELTKKGNPALNVNSEQKPEESTTKKTLLGA